MSIPKHSPHNKQNSAYWTGIKQVLHHANHIFLDKILPVLKRAYSVITVISTLTIFTAILLFAIGKLGIETSSDDDLIMRDIQRQIPKDLTIREIVTHDIHGFGNNSIIVLADDYSSADDQRLANQLLIFDKIENTILNRVYNLFGYGSNYKLSYIFSLASDTETPYWMGYSVELLDVIELTGDLSKELVIKFMSIPPGTSGYYQIGIFSYSFEEGCYYLAGTYPPAEKYEVNQESPGLYFWDIQAPTVFHKEDASQYNYYDKKGGRFELEWGTMDDRDFFIESEDGILLLVRTKTIWDTPYHLRPHRHIISVFVPNFNIETNELEWNILFSKETEEQIMHCTEEFVIEFLKENR